MNIYLCILCKEESYNDGHMCDECLDKISKGMCGKCGVKEDEVLVESSMDGIVLKTERLCEDCFQEEHDDVD